MPFTLYGFAGNPRTNAVKAVAEYEGVDLKYVDVGDVMNKETLPKEFTQKFPQTKVPALDADGFLVTETLAIAYYLAKDDKSNLFGKSAEEKARILQWASFANTNLIGALSDWFFPIVRGPFNKKSSEEGKAAAAKLYAYLDKVLANKTYLVGERVTFADLMVSAVLQRGCDHVVDPTFFKQYPNLLRYFHTVLRQPAVLKSKGGKEPTIIEKPKEYTPVKKEKAPAAEKPAAAPKAEKAPKEKAAKKPAAPADDEEEEEPAAAEPKAKHPCDLLGKPTFNLEDWKRKYSNEDTPVAMKWFEENYKPDEYSLWLVDYKYNEELTKKVFMSSNLIGGFHTRLEGSRKHLFGSACVYGEDNADKHAIRGVYLCRGQSWEDVFNVGPDYESYSFKQLDFSKPEDKETVGQNWSWEDKVDGMAAADGKVFK